MSRLQAIWSHRYIPYVGDFLPAPRPAPVAQDTAPGIARPVLGWFKPSARLLRRMAQPLYPAVDLSIGPWAEFTVTGSAAGGGEALLVTQEGLAVPLELGSDEIDRIAVIDVGPDLGSGETIPALAVVPVVRAWPILGPQGIDVTATMVASLSVVENKVYLALGTGQIQPGTIYKVTVHVPSSRGAVRRLVLPRIVCRQ